MTPPPSPPPTPPPAPPEEDEDAKIEDLAPKSCSIASRFAKSTARITQQATASLMKGAASHLQSMFKTLNGTKQITSSKHRERAFSLASIKKSYKSLSVGSPFPNIPLFDLDDCAYTDLFSLCRGTQLLVVEFYVSHTRKAEPIIAIDP